MDRKDRNKGEITDTSVIAAREVTIKSNVCHSDGRSAINQQHSHNATIYQQSPS